MKKENVMNVAMAKKGGLVFACAVISYYLMTASARHLEAGADDHGAPVGLVAQLPPVGAIVAWHKSLQTVPQQLPPGWVECNGGKVSAGPLQGSPIPDLNGAALFLRGSNESGKVQDDALQGHRHDSAIMFRKDTDQKGYVLPQEHYGHVKYAPTQNNMDLRNDVMIQVLDPKSDGVHGAARTDYETRPKNMSVVWIMRVQ
jgi:hypothetical protein